MTKTVLKPDWAVATLRLDPARFPQQVTYGKGNGATDVAVTLDERGAVLRKVLSSSGLPLSFALPARAFKGVAARAIDHGDGQVTVTLELHHDDPDLCVPLLVAHDLCDIAADWRLDSLPNGLAEVPVLSDRDRANPRRAEIPADRMPAAGR